MSWLGALNFILLQWLWLRLAAVAEDDGRVSSYVWFVGVVPLTGWWSDFVVMEKRL